MQLSFVCLHIFSPKFSEIYKGKVTMTMNPHIPQIQQLSRFCHMCSIYLFFVILVAHYSKANPRSPVIFPMFTSVNMALKNTLFTEPQCRYLITTMPLSQSTQVK